MLNDKFTWQPGDIRIVKRTPVSRSMLIARLQAVIAQYEMRADPSPADTIEYEEAKTLLASLLAQRED